ncbi:uncharacterized protein SETTUDRAFT_98807 [Exserohilum turcica Et28A]|uniref:Rhodopsin domain-containing protein n=1 Tax=Exserohilum turcicum (strain 28A) TaxID=671987 RepID=R0JKC7_EXST2|nr:uncharacterized protein SETTUDRAFT_98807 [Exserohilum turcica Et28A]EOA81748.1 hypothetical protein SETTUDRAFT_98807 [Exserohilum turcica Et28A]
MQLPPVSVILSWPTPNYHDPVTRGPALVIINSIFVTIATLTLFTLGLTTVVLLANKSYGWNRHIWDIPFTQFVPTAKIAMTAKVVFTAAATFTRLSLHCFYYRLVSESQKSWFKWLVHFNVLYTLCIFISFTFLSIFICVPVSDYWTIGAPPDACLNEAVTTLVCGIINCIADLLTTITPIPLVLSLQMPLNQRLAVTFLFGIGLLVTAAGVVRTWYIYRSLFNEYDQTWYAYPLWIAAAVEIDLGVICASAPVLKPLLAKIPFSLSSTFTRGIHFKNSVVDTSKTLIAGRSANFVSKRRSTGLQNIPELVADKGQSYEMKNWADGDAGFIDLETGSREVTLETDQEPKKGVTRLLDKLRSKASTPEPNHDMSITLTSQDDICIEPVRLSHLRHEQYGNPYESHMSMPLPVLSPLPIPKPSRCTQ